MEVYKQPNLSFAIPSPRLAPPSYRDRGHVASPRDPTEAAIRHLIQITHLRDPSPITDDNSATSLNHKAVFFMGSHLRWIF